MTSMELQIGIVVAIALVGAGFGVRSLVRGVLDPLAQEWITRHDLASGSSVGLSRGLSSGPRRVGRAPVRRPVGRHPAPTPTARAAALR